jgi:hypothetical protein
MRTLARRPAAFTIRTAERRAYHGTGHDCLILRPTEDGWSLISPSGELVFRGLGTAGRRHCLEFARDHGVLSVLS